MIPAAAPILSLPSNDYPTTDGRPMAETDLHRELMFELIYTLQDWYADDPNTYVSGNLLLFYESGNKRRHLSPDCFVVKGVPKGLRPNFLTWEEGHSPDVVFELTSSSTRSEDTKKKFLLYRDVLKVKEYFLFDPKEDYLNPSMQGYRLFGGEYRPIRPKLGRMPSRVLGLHLERIGHRCRLWNPLTESALPTFVDERKLKEEAMREASLARDEAESERIRASEETRRRMIEEKLRVLLSNQVEFQANRAKMESERAESEKARADELTAELEKLRRKLGDSHP